MGTVRTQTRTHVRTHAFTHTAVVAALALLILLLLAAEAQAYVPGQLIWAKRIGTSAGEASAWAVAGGPGGVVAIAGWQDVPPTGQVPMVARFTPGGAKWVRTYASPGRAEAVAIDKAGNVYVAATVDQREGDIVVLKYSAAGVFQWATAPYDGTGGGSPDEAGEIAVDGAGNVIVAGTSVVNGTGLPGIAVLKYNPDGNAMWPVPAVFFPSIDYPDEGRFYLEDLAVGGAGDVYVAGSQMRRTDGVWRQYAIAAKLDSSSGGSGGPMRYQPADGRSCSFASIAVRGYRVVAVGSTWDTATGADEHALLRKFDVNLAPGTVRYWGAGDVSEEWFNDVTLDAQGRVYVTGVQRVDSPTGYSKAVTLKFGADLAKVLWKAAYLPKSREAAAWYLVRDGLGNVYVSGVKDTGDSTGFLTMKLSPTGLRKWLKTWSGGGTGDDEPSGLVLGTKGDLFVGGEAHNKSGVLQAVVLRYKR